MSLSLPTPNPGRRNSRVNGLANPEPLGSLYVTGCSICRRGVYKGQPWVWLNNPIGISHQTCATANLALSTKEAR